MSTDTRWRQRYVNFQKAMRQLDAAVELEDYTDLEREGLIQRFEYCIELAWKTLQDLLGAKGYDIKGPVPVIKQAFQDGYLLDGDTWLEMWDSRKLTSHTYNEDTAIEIADKIKNEYYFQLDALDKRLAEEKEEE